MGCCASQPQTNDGHALGQNGNLTPKVASTLGYQDCNSCGFWSAAMDPNSSAFDEPKSSAFDDPKSSTIDDEDASIKGILTSAEQILKLKAEEGLTPRAKRSEENGITHFREDTANIDIDFTYDEPRNGSGEAADDDRRESLGSYPLNVTPAQVRLAEA
eukprot:571906-Prorocentrum_minimum.AAC.1